MDDGQHREASALVIVLVYEREVVEVRGRPDEDDRRECQPAEADLTRDSDPADKSGSAPANPPITVFWTMFGFRMSV